MNLFKSLLKIFHLDNSPRVKFITNNRKMKKWLIDEGIFKETDFNDYKILGNKIIFENGGISVKGNVKINYECKFEHLRVKFNDVWGTFICSNHCLKSTIGFPNNIYDDFTLHNSLVSSLDLENCTIHKKITISHNDYISNLNGFPKTEVEGAVWGDQSVYIINNCDLLSLEGCPTTVNGNFKIARSPNLSLLIGGPQLVNGNFEVYETGILSLRGAPAATFGEFIVLSNNMLCSFQCEAKISCDALEIKNCPKLESFIDFENNIQYCKILYIDMLRKGGLGILTITGLQGIFGQKYSSTYDKEMHLSPRSQLCQLTLQKHLVLGKCSLFDCQEELITLGLEQNAIL